MNGAPAEKPDLLLMTLDALRFDTAEAAYRSGETPFLEALLPHGWELRHTPGSFTYAAHAAFFAGFWPTPAVPAAADRDHRPFALRFHGSRTVGPSTHMLEGGSIVEGLRRCGYHTVCIGGVGFFNQLNPLGSVFPQMFDESHWTPEFGVGELHSTREQIRQAIASVQNVPVHEPLFLFINVSATHPPTRFYLPGARGESVATQTAALAYVDRQLPPLFEVLKTRRSGRAFLMSDHGTLFGEEGRTGHRLAHPMVWNVPYGEASWESE